MSALLTNGVTVATSSFADERTSAAADTNKSNGDAVEPNSNGGSHDHVEATDDVKASQQHIRNLETELKHAHEALAGLFLKSFFLFIFTWIDRLKKRAE